MSSKELTYLFKHSTIYGLGTTLGQIVGFIMLPVYTRYLTPKDYGILNLIEITTFLMGMVITTGIAQTLSRFYYERGNRKEQDKTVSTMYITYVILSVCVTPLVIISSRLIVDFIFDTPEYITYLYISFASFILGGLLDIGLVYLRIINKSILFTYISVSRLILLLSFNIWFVVYLELGVLGILYSSLITRIIYQLVLTFPILSRIKLHFSYKYSKEMMRFSLPLVPANLASTFVNQSDRYFINYFISLADTGIYSLAQKLGTAIHLFITSSFQSAFEPRRFEIVKHDGAKETFNKIFIFHTLVMVVTGLILSIYIPELLALIVTPEFYVAGKYVPLIIFSMVLFGLRNHFEFGILWSKKTKYFAYINGVMSVVNLVFNAIFISTFGLWGAIYSATLTIIIHDFLIYIISKKYYNIKFDFSRIFKLISLAIFIYCVSLTVSSDSIAMSILLKLILVFAFVCLVFLTRIVPEEEFKIIKEWYTRKFIDS